MLEYINGLLDQVRVLGTTGNRVIQTWVDMLSTVHRDMKSYTGGVMSFGRGMVHHRLAKKILT